MNHLLRAIVILGLAQIGVVASSNAQATWTFNGAGSSALYLEGGEAAASYLQSIDGTAYQCLWTAPSGVLTATDGQTSVVEKGQSWVAWSIDTSTGGTNCANPGTSVTVYSYEQTDSVVGNRLLWNSSTMQGTAAGLAAATDQLAYTGAPYPNGWDTSTNPGVPGETTNLPANVQTLLGTSTLMTAAGTDIRPEDAAFATLRVGGTNCAASIAGSQYLGLGYGFETSPTSLVTVNSFFSTSTFNVTNFSLPSTYQVYRFGAAPIIVHVNQTDGTPFGFNDTSITNLDSGELAKILDGTESRTEDIQGGEITSGPGSESIIVLLREPLSGTYNTMEYNDPNTLENQTSMDVGSKQLAAQQNCSGTGVKSNPMQILTTDVGGVQGYRGRVIGTGEMEKVIFGGSGESPLPVGPVLGWSFWSKPNFQNAYSAADAAGYNTNARYLTVDNIDPLMANYGPYPSTTSPAATATITAYSTEADTITAYTETTTAVTFTAANTLTAGELVTLTGITTGPTFLNGQTLPVLSTGLSATAFEVPYSGTAASGAANGTAEGSYVTLTSANTLRAGELVTLSVSAGPTYLNGLTLPVAVTGLSATQFEVADSTGATGSGAATGSVWAGGLCPAGTCPAGTIPTATNGGLNAVTMTNVIDGSYPIWSFLRVVCSGAATTPQCVAAAALANTAQNYVALGSSVDALHPPDFVPVGNTVNPAWNSIVVRSHFTPPGVTVACTVSNGTTTVTTGSKAAPECGGDVGGVVYTIEQDRDYETDNQGGLGVKEVGEINQRR
jgi:hypothetical protein